MMALLRCARARCRELHCLLNSPCRDLKGPNVLVVDGWHAKVRSRGAAAAHFVCRCRLASTSPAFTPISSFVAPHPQVADFNLSGTALLPDESSGGAGGDESGSQPTQASNPRWLAPELMRGGRATAASGKKAVGEAGCQQQLPSNCASPLPRLPHLPSHPLPAHACPPRAQTSSPLAACSTRCSPSSCPLRAASRRTR